MIFCVCKIDERVGISIKILLFISFYHKMYQISCHFLKSIDCGTLLEDDVFQICINSCDHINSKLIFLWEVRRNSW